MGSFWGANIVGISFPIVQYHSNLYTKKKKKKLAYSYYFVQDCDKIKIREKSTKKEGFSVFSNTSY